MSSSPGWSPLGIRPRLVLLVLVLALTTRLGVLLFVSHPELRGGRFEFSELSDEGQYHNIASAVAKSGRYLDAPSGEPTALRTPGSTLPIAAVYWLFGSRPILAAGYVLVCSIINVLLLGALAHRTFGSRAVTLIAMLLGATIPSLVIYSAGIWSDPPALLWTMLALYLMLVLEDGSMRIGRALMMGLVLGLAQITRTSGGVLTAMVLAVLIFRGVQTRQLRSAAVVAVAAAMPVVIWGAHNQQALGEFFVGSSLQWEAMFGVNNAVTAGLELPVRRFRNGHDLYEEAEKGMYFGRMVPPSYVLAEIPERGYGRAELELNSFYRQRTLQFIKRHPTALVRLVAFKARRFLTAEPLAPSILGESEAKRRLRWIVAALERWFVFLFGAAGMTMMFRQGHRCAIPYAVVLAASIATVLISGPSARNLLPATACLIPPAAMAMESGATRLLEWSRRD